MDTTRGGSSTGNRAREGSPSAATEHPATGSPNICDPDELDALQISDSLFPTGMFASSSGLELMFEQNMITTVEELTALCRNMIEHQVGPADCVALAAAHDASASGDVKRLGEIDAACASMKIVREAREASARSGVQLCRCVAAFCDDDRLSGYIDDIASGEGASGVYPVALGVCCRALGIARGKAALILLYGFASGMAGAALRLGIIQHVEAQQMIHGLKPAMREAAATAASATTGDAPHMWQFCPHAEILQMAHERMETKMFIT